MTRPAWYRPRRRALPAFLCLAALWWLPLHAVVALSCHSLSCRPEPMLPVAASLATLPPTYLLAAALTRVAARRSALDGRAPWLFAPPDAVRTAAVALAATTGLVSLATAYHYLVTPLGLAAAYVTLFPALGLSTTAALGWRAAGLAGPFPALLLAALTLLLAAAAQVGWWYLLAHGLVRGGRWVRSVRSDGSSLRAGD